jgi:hypothetical protein
MSKLEKGQQYDFKTTEIAKFLGLTANVIPMAPSPKQIDHLVDGYFGWLGTNALKYVDVLFKQVLIAGGKKFPEKPTMQLSDLFIVGNFAKELPSSSSSFVTKFYEQSKEMEQAYNSHKAMLKEGRIEEAKKYKEEHKDELAGYSKYSRIKLRMTELNNKIRKIENDMFMSSQEKRARIDTIRKQEHNLTRSL